MTRNRPGRPREVRKGRPKTYWLGPEHLRAIENRRRQMTKDEGRPVKSSEALRQILIDAD